MGSWKLERHLEAGALPKFLRQLAQALESGQGGGAFEGLPAQMRKLVLVADQEGDGLDVKLKAKRDKEVLVPTKPKEAKSSATEPRTPLDAQGARGGIGQRGAARPKAQADDRGERAREKYRQLKKAMQADYKALRKAAEAGGTPPQDVLESFLALSESMAEVEQPLKDPRGPEASELAKANAAFVEDARALRRALSARDAGALLEVLDRLERRKSACHAQYR
jgi:XXXCH domain-containing protein